MIDTAITRRQMANRFLREGRAAFRTQDVDSAFAFLEDAHVLGQPYLRTHLTVHWWMLRVGLHQKDLQEVWGQLVRLMAAPIGHLTGRLPVGNTGRANVPALRSMPIPSHLREIIDSPEEAE